MDEKPRAIEKPSFLASSGLVTLLTVAVSVVSFANQLLIAKTFGVTSQLTAYQVAISGPSVVSGILSASLSLGMVPLLVRRRLEDDDPKAFCGAMTLRILLLCVCLMVVGYGISDPLVGYLGRSLAPPMLSVAKTVGRISWITMGFTVMIAQLTAVENSVHRFLWPVLAGSGPYFGMVAGVVLLGRNQGVLAIALGLLAGTSVAVSSLAYAIRGKVRFAKPSDSQIKPIAVFFRQLPAIAISSLIFTSFQFIDAYWAPQVGPSSLPTLGFGQRLLIAFGNLVISGPSAILSPRMAEAIAEGRESDFFRYAEKAIRTTLGFGGAIAAIVSVLSTPIVRVLFQRGRFDSQATEQLSGALPWMMAGMVFMLCMVMMFGAFYARNSVVPTVCLSLGTVGGYFAVSGLLSLLYGTSGIAAAYLIVWFFSFMAGIGLLWRGDAARLWSRTNLDFVLKLALSLGGAALVTFCISRGLHPLFAIESVPTDLMGLSLAGCGGLVAFYAMADRLFKIDEIQVVFYFLGGLLRRLPTVRSRRA